MTTKTELPTLSQSQVPESVCLFGGWSRRKILKMTEPIYEVSPQEGNKKEDAVAVS